MVSLYDKRESVFARRYAALQMEWKGHDAEPTAVFFGRLRREITNFELSTFKSDQLGGLLLLLAMRSPSLDKLRTLILTKMREDPAMTLSQCEDLMLDHLATAYEQKLPEQPNVSQVHGWANRCKKPKSSANDQSGKKVSSGKSCYRCNGPHDADQCRFKDAECHKCGRKGHLKRNCKVVPKAPRFNVFAEERVLLNPPPKKY
uniref:CCHC-type domain-containing protein n=1 Tax=Panagrellus redivivus TaxID=6233 RepID=A0A7E4W0C5_PANRE